MQGDNIPFILEVLYVIFVVIVLYFGFLFLLLFLSNKKKLNYIPTIKKFPSVSIIIPAYNEEKNIEKTINNIKSLNYPSKLDIVVVDDGSTDKTPSILKRIKGIRVFRKPNAGKANALNYGLKRAKGDIVACIDADSYPTKDALLYAVPFFEDPKVAAVTTSIFVKKYDKIIEKLQALEYVIIAWFRKMLEYIDSIYVTPGPMSLYRKDVLLKIGGFDEKNMTEDVEIAWRLLSNNYKIKMSLKSKVYTIVPNNMRSWWHQRLRWNIGGIQTSLKYLNKIFKKDYGMVGVFLLPFFSISYILSIISLFSIIYVIYLFVGFLIGSYSFGFQLIEPSRLYFIPNYLSVLAVLVSVLSLTFILVTLKSMVNFSSVKKVAVKFNFLVYLFIYSSIFQLNMLHSFYKILRGNFKW